MASKCNGCGIVDHDAADGECAFCGEPYEAVILTTTPPPGWLNKSRKGAQRWREAGGVSPRGDHDPGVMSVIEPFDDRYDWPGPGKEPPRWVHEDGTVVYRADA